MDRRSLAALVISALFALGTAGVFYRCSLSASRLPAAKTRVLVVAASNLAVGTKIRTSDLKLVAVPEAFASHSSFSRVEDLEGRPVIGAVFQGEPLLEERVAARGSGAGLAPLIPAGQRAVSVRVDDVIGVAGFAQPGMRVDVLVTGRMPGSEDYVTRTVLQNIIVLSSGRVLQAEPKGQAIPATVVTLQVDPHEAEILIVASAEGHIQLVLRNSTDSRKEATQGISLSAIYGPAPAKQAGKVAGQALSPTSPPTRPRPAPPISPPEVPSLRVHTVEVIRGNRKALEQVDSRPASEKFPEPESHGATNL